MGSEQAATSRNTDRPAIVVSPKLPEFGTWRLRSVMAYRASTLFASIATLAAFQGDSVVVVVVVHRLPSVDADDAGNWASHGCSFSGGYERSDLYLSGKGAVVPGQCDPQPNGTPTVCAPHRLRGRVITSCRVSRNHRSRLRAAEASGLLWRSRVPFAETRLCSHRFHDPESQGWAACMRTGRAASGEVGNEFRHDGA